MFFCAWRSWARCRDGMLPLAPLERELVRTGTAGTVLVRLALELRAIMEAS